MKKPTKYVKGSDGIERPSKEESIESLREIQAHLVNELRAVDWAIRDNLMATIRSNDSANVIDAIGRLPIATLERMIEWLKRIPPQ
jgi:hypothetical protein